MVTRCTIIKKVVDKKINFQCIYQSVHPIPFNSHQLYQKIIL
ncbi:MAG TPA: hypothetical protein VJK51_04870 [Candidatus Nanoarchaeia archaeon]|nr:hypothetical protein [Candidatus Nanoarchaeia archaeon]